MNDLILTGITLVVVGVILMLLPFGQDIKDGGRNRYPNKRPVLAGFLISMFGILPIIAGIQI